MEDLAKQVAEFKKTHPEFEVVFEVKLKETTPENILPDTELKYQEPNPDSVTLESFGLPTNNYSKAQKKWRQELREHPEKAKYQKTCTICEARFGSIHPNAKYCSNECRAKVAENYKVAGLERRARKFEGSDYAIECSFCGRPTRQGPWCSNECRVNMEKVISDSLIPKVPKRERHLKLVGVKKEVIKEVALAEKPLECQHKWKTYYKTEMKCSVCKAIRLKGDLKNKIRVNKEVNHNLNILGQSVKSTPKPKPIPDNQRLEEERLAFRETEEVVNDFTSRMYSPERMQRIIDKYGVHNPNRVEPDLEAVARAKVAPQTIYSIRRNTEDEWSSDNDV